MHNIKNYTDGFWHRQVSVEPICLYRLGVGVFLCGSTVEWLKHTKELFSNQGLHIGIFQQWAPPPAVTFLVCLTLVIAGLFVAIGFWTRFSIITSWILFTYLNGIDAINEKAVSTVVQVVLLFLLLIDTSARYSVDDLLRQRRGHNRYPAEACVFPQRLLQIYFAQTYFFCGLVKALNPQWVYGQALFYILQGRWATDWGFWLAVTIPPIVIQIASLVIIMFELLAGFLIFVPRARNWIIMLGVLFQLMAYITLNVEYLSYHFIWALIILYPEPEAVVQKVNKIRSFLLNMKSKYFLTAKPI